MKKQFLIILSISFLITIVEFTACKKEEQPKTASEFLTEGNWIISAITIDPGMDMGTGSPVTDMYPYLEECSLDDIMDFQSNGTIQMDAGAIKCDPNDPQRENLGSWTLSNNNSTLTISDPLLGPIEGTVLILNATTFKMRNQFEDLDKEGNTKMYQQTMTLISK